MCWAGFDKAGCAPTGSVAAGGDGWRLMAAVSPAAVSPAAVSPASAEPDVFGGCAAVTGVKALTGCGLAAAAYSWLSDRLPSRRCSKGFTFFAITAPIPTGWCVVTSAACGCAGSS
jgi:hypothetical protein